MEAALSELEFLARSKNRVRVLQLLATEAHTRGELGETTGASQATLSRILEDFSERSWVHRTDEGYVTTATGTMLADELARILGTITTERKLRAVASYLPADAFDFDLTVLADATVTVPTQTKPTAPLQRILAHVRSAETLTAISHTFNERTLAVVTEQVKAGNQTFEGVFAEETIEALAADAESWALLTELAACDTAQVWVQEAGVPVAAVHSPGTVTFLLRDEDGLIQAALQTADEAVTGWLTDTVEEFKTSASPFRPARYTAE